MVEGGPVAAGVIKCFNTRAGKAYVPSVAQAAPDARHRNVDRIERATLALEVVAGIKEAPI